METSTPNVAPLYLQGSQLMHIDIPLENKTNHVKMNTNFNILVVGIH